MNWLLLLHVLLVDDTINNLLVVVSSLTIQVLAFAYQRDSGIGDHWSLSMLIVQQMGIRICCATHTTLSR